MNLYSQWLDEDSSELELSQEQLAQLKDKLKTVTERISDHSSMLEAKSSTLQEKEERLSVRCNVATRGAGAGGSGLSE